MRNTSAFSNNIFLIREQEILILEELIPAKAASYDSHDVSAGTYIYSEMFRPPWSMGISSSSSLPDH